MNIQNTNHEKIVRLTSGWPMLPVVILMYLGFIGLFITSLVIGNQTYGHPVWWMFAVALLLLPTGLICTFGFFSLQPNEARVLILFGEYRGTVRESGFYWANPFYSNSTKSMWTVSKTGINLNSNALSTTTATAGLSRCKISLRARNLNGDRLKVNDKRGNPIEIAAVVVWRVQDTAQAFFDVDDYESYVRIQSESALRHLASLYAYDHGEENETTLRSGVDDVSKALCQELQERLQKAGVVVEEARLTHLAYAPEIAQAMLRRQQAEAVIAARQKIVHGAVSMVSMALKELAEKQVVQLDDERKAAMVSNLMVVLCGESEVHPVVNTGTLYS